MSKLLDLLVLKHYFRIPKLGPKDNMAPPFWAKGGAVAPVPPPPPAAASAYLPTYRKADQNQKHGILGSLSTG